MLFIRNRHEYARFFPLFTRHYRIFAKARYFGCFGDFRDMGPFSVTLDFPQEERQTDGQTDR